MMIRIADSESAGIVFALVYDPDRLGVTDLVFLMLSEPVRFIAASSRHTDQIK